MRGACPCPFPDARVPAQVCARLSQAAHPRRSVPVPARTPPRVRTHVNARACARPRNEQPRLAYSRDETRLALVRPSRATEFTSQQRTWAGWWGEREVHHHARLCTRDVRSEQPQEARLEQPSSPSRSRPASSEQARRASPAVSHLEGGRGRRAVSCNTPPHGQSDDAQIVAFHDVF